MEFELASGEDNDLDLDSGFNYVSDDQYQEYDILYSEEYYTDPDVENDLVVSSPDMDQESIEDSDNENTILISDLNQADPYLVELSSDPQLEAPLELISGNQDILTEGAEYQEDSQELKKEVIVTQDPESVEHLSEIKSLLERNLENNIPQSSDYGIDDIYVSIEDLKNNQEELLKTVKIIGKDQMLYQDLTLGFTIAFFAAFILYLFIGRIR